MLLWCLLQCTGAVTTEYTDVGCFYVKFSGTLTVTELEVKVLKIPQMYCSTELLKPIFFFLEQPVYPRERGSTVSTLSLENCEFESSF